MTVNGRVRKARRGTAPAARPLPARTTPAHRHTRRLRHQSVRRLHGADRRPQRQGLHASSPCRLTAPRSRPSKVWPRTAGLHPVQQGFWEEHGLQCGFCTPGMIMSAVNLLQRHAEPDRAADPRRHLRKLLPLHRLSAHRQRHPARREQGVDHGRNSRPAEAGRRARQAARRSAPDSGARHVRRRRQDRRHAAPGVQAAATSRTAAFASIDTSAAEAMDGVEAVFTGRADRGDAGADADRHPVPLAAASRRRRGRRALRRRAGGGRRREQPLHRARRRRRHRGRVRSAAGGRRPRAGDDGQARRSSTRIFPNNLAVALVPSGTGVSPDGNGRRHRRRRRRSPPPRSCISQRMMNQRLVPNAMEPRGVVAHFEPGKGSMTIWSSTQNPHILRTMIAAMTGPRPGPGPRHRARSRRRLRRQDQHLRRGVRRGGDLEARSACRSSGWKTAPRPSSPPPTGATSSATWTWRRRRDGKVLGLKLRLIADIGAYNMLLTAAIPTLTMLMANAHLRHPGDPHDAHRGLHEQDADRRLPRRRPSRGHLLRRARDGHAGARAEDGSGRGAAEELHPVRTSSRYATQMGAVYDSGDYDKALDLALKASNWTGARRRARRGTEGRTARRPRAGDVRRGLRPRPVVVAADRRLGTLAGHRSSATAASAPPPARRRTARATRRPSRRCSPTSSACPIEHITILHGDTGVVKQGIGTFGSRSQAVGGTALHLAGGKVKAKMAKFAAALLEAHEDDIVFENGTIGGEGRAGVRASRSPTSPATPTCRCRCRRVSNRA